MKFSFQGDWRGFMVSTLTFKSIGANETGYLSF